ncbi:MAG: hypothetical protein GY714_12380 [Desulfobacterales bacterium]|nr:hypothetical protein [Desulfobacterales bacterium]
MAETNCIWKEEDRGDEASVYSRACHKEHILITHDRNPNPTVETKPEVAKFKFCAFCGSEINWENIEKLAKD